MDYASAARLAQKDRALIESQQALAASELRAKHLEETLDIMRRELDAARVRFVIIVTFHRCNTLSRQTLLQSSEDKAKALATENNQMVFMSGLTVCCAP